VSESVECADVTVVHGDEDLSRDEAITRLAVAERESERLRSENARLAEENRAFVTSARHLTNAAEQVLADARREAADTRARAAAEAYERLIVARADARLAVHEEREKTAAELELLAAVRERIMQERSSLSTFQNELSGRLRDLVRAVFDFEEHAPMLAPGPSWSSDDHISVVDEPVTASGSVVESAVVESAVVESVVVDDRDPRRNEVPMGVVVDPSAVDPAEPAEEELEAAFAAFFSTDVEGEPSRHWILNDR
jgi:hypothetical protein